MKVFIIYAYWICKMRILGKSKFCCLSIHFFNKLLFRTTAILSKSHSRICS